MPIILRHPKSVTLLRAGVCIAALTAASPALAAAECGADGAGADTITCTGASFPNGITYAGSDGLNLTLNDPTMAVLKGTATDGINLGGTTANDLTVTATSLTSVNGGTGTAVTVNNGGDGKAKLTINAGTFTAAAARTVFATHASGAGDSVITMAGGLAANTFNTTSYTLDVENTGSATGNATILVTGGTIQTNGNSGSFGMRALISNAASSGNATVTMTGGAMTGAGTGAQASTNGSGLAQVTINGASINSTGNTGALATNTGSGNAVIRVTDSTIASGNVFVASGLNATANSGSATVTATNSSVTAKGSGGAGIQANSSSGPATVTMTGGSVSNSAGSGTGLKAVAGGTATASVTLDGGTVTTTGTGAAHGVSAQAAGGQASVRMTGGTVTTTSITADGLRAQSSNGLAVVEMTGGTVTANGNVAAVLGTNNNSGTGTYDISITGGTVNGSVQGYSTAPGGVITIGPDAIINAKGGVTGIALSTTGLNAAAGTITTAGAITGQIAFEPGTANTLNITGGSIAGDIVGGGTDTVNFDLGSGSFTYDAAYAITGVTDVAMKSGTATLADTLTTNTVTVTGGTLVLTGAINAPAFALNGGILSVSDDANLGTDAGALNFNGGTLQVTGTAFTSTPRTVTLGANGGTFDIVDPANVWTLNQLLAGGGSLTKQGAGTLTLAAANTYTGATIISAGTLAVTDADAVAASSGVRDDGLFDVSAGGASIKSLSGSGTVALGAQALAITAAADTFGGTIQGTGDLHLSGGTQTLTGTNTYSGDTYIDAGELRVAAGGQVSGTSLVFFSAGALTVTGAGSAFTASSDFIMGRGTGTAAASVTDGGHLTTSRSFLGEGANYSTAGAIQVTVDGAGSVWDAGSYFQMGAAAGGTASLTISNGGVMTGGTGVIGRGGDATALVTGMGSQLLSGSLLQIGAPFNAGAGHGQLTIADGGLVDASLVALSYNDDGTITGNSATLTVQGTPGARGVLQTAALSKGFDAATASFDGGVLRASGDNTGFISSYAGDFVTIGAGGMFLDTNGFNVTASSGLAGAGALTEQGGGTLILSAANSYAGGTTIETGVLQLGDGGTSGSITGNVSDNGTLVFNRSDAVTFTGVISGSGSIVQAGPGHATLTGANSYAGGTSITAGTLTGAATSFGSGAITDNAALVVDQAADAAFANAINGGGSFTKQGAGRLNYTGAGTLSGATTVAAGTLSVNGTLAASAVTVQSGAILGGNGTVGATVIQSGATIAPGNSIGTLHINGAYRQAAGSVYQVQLDPNSNASDLITASGAATLDNGAGLTVVKDQAGPYRLGAKYTVLHADGGITGIYALGGDTLAASPYLGLRDSYDANNAYLSVVQTTDPATAAQTGNQAQTATGVDSLPVTGDVPTAVLNTPDPVTTRGAFDQLSGAALASANSLMISGSVLVRDTTFDRLRDVFCATPDDNRHTGCVAFADRPTVWAQGFGGWNSIYGNGNAAGISQTSGGFLVGADVPVQDWRIGMFGGYSRSDFTSGARDAQGRSNSYHLGAYGGTAWGDLGLRLGASYSWNGLATERLVAFDDFSNDLRATYNAGTTQFFTELGQKIALDGLLVEPFANLAYVNLHTGGFRETGGAAALTSRANTLEDTFATLGVRPSTEISLGDTAIVARGMLGWRHTFGDMRPASVVSFDGGSAFTVAGVPIARDAGVAEAGVSVNLSDTAALGLTYGGQFSNRETDHSIRGTLAITF